MTAHELAQQLLAGPDHEVRYAYPAGDYWCNVLLGGITETKEEYGKYSQYHGEYRATDDQDHEECLDDLVPFIVLS